MPRKKNASSIRRLVVLFVLLCLAPLGALAVSSVRLASDALQTEVEGRVASAAQLSAVAVRGELEGVSDLVESYAERPSLVETLSAGPPKAAELAPQLQGLRQARPGIAVAFIARPDGRLLGLSPRTDSIVGKDFSFRDWYRGVSATGRTYVSEAFVGQAAGKPLVVAIATIVRDGGGRKLAILAAAYELKSLQGSVNRFADSQDVFLTLTDRRGTVLASPGASGAELVSRRADMLVAAAMRGESGVTTHDDRLVAYRPIEALGWTVSASVPKDSALAAVGRLRAAVFGATGLLALVLLAGFAFLIRSLSQRRRAREEAEQARAEAEALLPVLPGDAPEDPSRARADFRAPTGVRARRVLPQLPAVLRLASRGVVGVEALVRWRHPERGVLLPGHFISAAERSGLIDRLGQGVLEQACSEVAELQRTRREPLSVSVNISLHQLRSADFVQDVRVALERSSLDPALLVLELTETVMLDDTAAASALLSELRRLGVRVALDDFGTGYSSLSYLRTLPIDFLKVDKEFIDELSDGGDLEYARAILSLGKTLHLQTVAEGIEEAGQVVELAALGCELGQGYFFARPLGLEALERFLEEHDDLDLPAARVASS